MRVASFERAARRSYGLLDGDRVLDAGSQLLQRYSDLRAVIAAGALDELRDSEMGSTPALRLLDVTLLPVIENSTKIICVGLNYVSHRTETKRPDTEYPSLFTRFSDTQVGHGARLRKPSFSTKFDCNVVAAVVATDPTV